ncbi:MAG: hypothetical protein E6J90_11990 [Deltaproteobacteria bacterium]|nr:MAG: hypothetical protein E6J91_19370 [Deltaproteobacteria bacterium]TMQ22600.1 MAG: hypothetical protein E6J90_11990 [Deltaproteobacteria bacterium]
MDDGQARDGRVRLARGTAPNAVRGAAAPDAVVAAQATPICATTEEPAGTIHEAIERWISAREADEAVEEWSQARA